MFSGSAVLGPISFILLGLHGPKIAAAAPAFHSHLGRSRSSKSFPITASNKSLLMSHGPKLDYMSPLNVVSVLASIVRSKKGGRTWKQLFGWPGNSVCHNYMIAFILLQKRIPFTSV